MPAHNGTLCVNSGLSLLALTASGFPPEGGRFTPFSPSDKKPEAFRSVPGCVCVGRGSRRLLRRRGLGAGARPESPPNGGVCRWWLSDRMYCAAGGRLRPSGIMAKPSAAVLILFLGTYSLRRFGLSFGGVSRPALLSGNRCGARGAVFGRCAQKSRSKRKRRFAMSVSGGVTGHAPASIFGFWPCSRTSTAQHKAKALRWLSDGSVLDGEWA